MERMTAAEYLSKHGGKGSKGDRRRVRGTKAVVVDGIKFHSTREAKRYRFLKLREMAGEIRDLRLQVEYELRAEEGPLLTPKRKQPMVYKLDFEYFDIALGEIVREDVKGHDTEKSEIKRAIMAANGTPVVLV